MTLRLSIMKAQSARFLFALPTTTKPAPGILRRRQPCDPIHQFENVDGTVPPCWLERPGASSAHSSSVK
jgi:hypothetical protein